MNFVFVYCTEDYPQSFSANNTKISILSEALVRQGHSVCIINNPKFTKHDSCSTFLDHGINIVNYPAGTSYLQKVSFLRKCLSANYVEHDSNIAIVSCGSFQDHLSALYYATRIGYKVGYIFQEWHLGLESSIKGKLNAFLNDNILLSYYDFILPISEYLINKTYPKNRTIFKLPIISSFPSCVQTRPSEDDYFLYCASILYKDVLDMLVDAYILYKGNTKLKVVLNGDAYKIEQYKLCIKMKGLDSNIEILSKLPYSYLLELYRGAKALFIPLRPDYIPDIARFSQKTAEYLSTGRPIVTTDVGEMSLYFKNNETAIFFDYNKAALAETMSEIDRDPDNANKIGVNGFNLAKELFDADVVAKNMVLFLGNI